MEEDAFAIGFLHQRQAVPILGEPGEALDEFHFRHALERRQARDFAFGQAHVARPPAAGGATLALMIYRHATSYAGHSGQEARNGILSARPGQNKRRNRELSTVPPVLKTRERVVIRSKVPSGY